MRLTLKTNHSRLAVLIALSMGSVTANAGEQVVDCPLEVPASSLKLVDIPNGFTGHIPDPIFLTGAGLMYGPPARMETSKPQVSKSSQGKEVAIWNDIGAVSDKWMACYYGSQDVILSRPIDDRARSCSVASTVKHHRYVIDARCTW